MDNNDVLKENSNVMENDENAKLVKISTTGIPKLFCSICNKALISLNAYVKHVKKHEPPGGFLCRYCTERFCTEDELKRHRESTHTTIACRLCKNINFTTEETYRTHIRVVHNGIDRELFTCNKCGAQYKTIEPYRRHMNTECGTIKPYKCDECTMSFVTKYNLKQHKELHEGDSKYCCSYCGKKFLQKGRLVEHERSHTGEKPYKCDVCGKCFAHRESIVTHTTIHTGIRLVECRCCQSRFSCYSNLIKHRRTRPDTCGLPEYDPPKNRIRKRSSRIPATINPTSEIRVSNINKIIKPDDQKKLNHLKKESSRDKIEEYSDYQNAEYKKTQSSILKNSTQIENDIKHNCSTNKRNNALRKLNKKKVNSRNPLEITSASKDFENYIDDSDYRTDKIEQFYDKHVNELNANDFQLPLHLLNSTETEESKQKNPHGVMTANDLRSKARSSDIFEFSTTCSVQLTAATATDTKTDNMSPEMNFKCENIEQYRRNIIITDCLHNILNLEDDDIPLTLYYQKKKKVKRKINSNQNKMDILAERELILIKNEINKETEDHSFTLPLEEDILDTKPSALSKELDICKVLLEDITEHFPQLKRSNSIKISRYYKVINNRTHESKKPNAITILKRYPKTVANQRKKRIQSIKDESKDRKHKKSFRLAKISQKELKERLKITKKQEKHWKCPHCIKIYYMKKPYETHLRDDHKRTEEEIRDIFKFDDTTVVAEEAFKCPICNKIYLMEKRLADHIKKHGVDGRLIYKCPCHCSSYFATREEATKHAHSQHKNMLWCELCQKFMTGHDALKSHNARLHGKMKHPNNDMNNHSKRNFICDKCGKKFVGRTQLTDHVRSDCGRLPIYQCTECGKCLTTAGILKTHMLLHNSDCPYKCEQCGKTFKIKAQYKSHVKFRHSNEKHFKCHLCPKAYPYRESLLTHMTVHTGIKRFLCNGCGKRFTCVSNLQAHRKVQADTCGLLPLNAKATQYMGVQKGNFLMGSKPEAGLDYIETNTLLVPEVLQRNLSMDQIVNKQSKLTSIDNILAEAIIPSPHYKNTNNNNNNNHVPPQNTLLSPAVLLSSSSILCDGELVQNNINPEKIWSTYD